MSLTPEEFLSIQCIRVQSLGYDLIATGHDTYPFRIAQDGEVIRPNLRSAHEISIWADGQEENAT